MTQFLSGHRAFRRHLFRFDLTNTPFCTFCGDEEDASEHAVFWCKKWTRKQEECRRMAGTLTVDNIVQKMIREERRWEVVQAITRKILKEKMREDGHMKGLKQYHLGKFVVVPWCILHLPRRKKRLPSASISDLMPKLMETSYSMIMRSSIIERP